MTTLVVSAKDHIKHTFFCQGSPNTHFCQGSPNVRHYGGPELQRAHVISNGYRLIIVAMERDNSDRIAR
jgi:hypothetical protein